MTESEIIFSPSEFVAIFNQTLETAYPAVVIEGELANFRIAKNRWLYFSLQDENSSVDFFGTVYQLPGPLQDGLKVKAVGTPKMHPRYGFTINLTSIAPVGEGSLKKAADLLAKKLEAEGLFAPERKRSLPAVPERVGLITAADSAAAADFIKVLNERWRGVEILLYDTYVQGPQAPLSLVAGIDYFNRSATIPDVLILTRGGGSADDLAAFNDERVVREIAASRAPTLVAIGHEVDISLAELAADQRASTPSNAAQILVPDRKHVVAQLENTKSSLRKSMLESLSTQQKVAADSRQYLQSQVIQLVKTLHLELAATRKLIRVFDPYLALKRGYAIVTKAGKHIKSVKQTVVGAKLDITLSDGTISALVEGE